MIRSTVYLVIAFALAFGGSTRAGDGMLTGVSPFAVHATVDGPSNHAQIEQLIEKATYKALRDARVPISVAVDIKEEVNPFFHWEFTARQVEGTGEVLCIARLSIKVKTTNPYNKTSMYGVFTSGFQVEVKDGMENAKAFFASYVESNVSDVIRAWRSHNPLPGGFQLPENLDGG